MSGHPFSDVPSGLASYALASLLSLAAIIIDAQISPEDLPGATLALLAAIVLSVWVGGRGPGLLSVALSCCYLEYAVVEPHRSIHIASFKGAFELIFFGVISFLLVWFVGRLRETKELLAAMFSSVGDAMIVADSRRRILLMNARAEEWTGMPRNIAGKKKLMDVWPAAAEPDKGKFESEGRTFERFEIPLLKYGVLYVFRDITERLKWEEQRLLVGRLISGMKDGFNVVDLEDGKILRTNEAFDRMFGYKPGELIGQHISIVNAGGPEGQRQIAESIWTQVQRRGFWEGEVLNKRKDGSEFLSFANITLHKERGRSYLTTIQQDITERKRAEEALREAKDVLQAVVEISPLAKIVFDLEGRVALWNPAAERLFGWSAAEALGSFNPILPEDHTAGESALELAETPGPPSGHETRRRRKDGSIIDVALWAAPLRDHSGARRGALAIFADITERRRLEDSIRERTSELMRSNEDLQQFAFIISHDLQEPLRIVSSYAQLVAKRYPDALGEEGHEFLRHITEGVSRMRQLIQDLLAYSRASQGGGLQMEETDVEGVVAWALMNLQVSIQESGANVTYEKLPTVYGDRAQLAQLFQNLIGNAIKYRSSAPPRIHIQAESRKGEWMFSVQDNGIGIAPEYRERVFGIFKRLHGREYPGTGIGLAICKRIVERHGGRIWVESEDGAGSKFYFTIAAA
ncbi:MAG: PAS domain S-box protein [Bryobacteraceae bacterium]|nr:PAS domain S-box protein [Bryobacterales bacterium]NUN00213.1 PAS domain S-box protein [Bryobacteraceae bacterium]